MNYSVEIGTLGGNALGNAGMGECDPGNSVKIFTEGRLALQAATWLALGRIPVQLWVEMHFDVDKANGQ